MIASRPPRSATPLARSLLPSLGVKWIGHAFRTSLDGASTSPPPSPVLAIARSPARERLFERHMQIACMV